MIDEQDEGLPFCMLHLFGHDLEPEDVTHRLDFQPDRSRKTGDVITGRPDPKGNVRTGSVKRGYWTVSSDKRISSNKIEDHLDWVLSAFSRKDFRAIPNVDEIHISIVVCSWHSSGGAEIPESLVSFAATINARLSVTVHFLHECDSNQGEHEVTNSE